MSQEQGKKKFEGEVQSLVATLLLFVAKGDGRISDLEADRMLALLDEHLGMPSAEALALLTRSMSDLGDDPDLTRLRGMGAGLSDTDKEDIVVMLLSVIAADGSQDVEEIDKLRFAAEVLEVSPELMHKSYGRYFDETA